MKVNESGRSMVEMLGVLAIIGVLSAGGLAGYSKAMFKHKLNNTIDQITMLVTNIRTMYGTQASYAGVGGANAAKLGIIPSGMEQVGSTFLNPFKGAVTLAAAKASSSDSKENQAFTINVAGLPLEACVTIASADWGAGAGSGFIGANAANGDTAADVSSLVAGTGNDGVPMTVNAAATKCSNGNSKVSNVTLKFY